MHSFAQNKSAARRAPIRRTATRANLRDLSRRCVGGGQRGGCAEVVTVCGALDLCDQCGLDYRRTLATAIELLRRRENMPSAA